MPRTGCIVMLLAALLTLPNFGARAQDAPPHAVVKEWLDRYHDHNALYLTFPDGTILRARAKWTGVLLGRMHLWLCGRYMPLRYRGDERIYLAARIITFVDKDATEVAARYKTQCALRQYSGNPYYEYLAPKHENVP